jgi:hypothetical protein
VKIRTCDVTGADKLSAKLFFDALFGFYEIGPDALDMFARDGALTVSRYYTEINNLDLWELNAEHRPALEKFNPREIIIGCSYTSMGGCTHKYDMVVIDTPQGIHNDAFGIAHIEHFDVLRHIKGMLKPKALIVLYVNKRPYNKEEVGSHGYDEYAEFNYKKWMAARASFYDVGSHGIISEEDAIAAYREVLADQNLAVTSVLSVPCYSDVQGVEPYAFRLALQVEPI